MKASRITLFIFSSIALLACLSGLFPNNGITIGSLTLRFPSIADVLQPANASTTIYAESLLNEAETQLGNMLSDSENLADKEEDEVNAKFEQFNKNNPARIYFPNNDPKFFDPLFLALDSAQKTPVRIVHFGDSQIEIDRISASLRECFQSRFGGNGPGLLPVIQTVPTISVRQTCSNAELPRFMPYGPAEFRIKHGRYGIMAQMTAIDGPVNCSFAAASYNDTQSRVKKFQKVSILVGNVTARLSISVSSGSYNNTQTIEPMVSSQQVTFHLPTSVSRVNVSMNGTAEIYGVMLDGEKGVSLDNIPMRGCGGTIFTAINSNEPKQFCRDNNVRLVIMQYGGNAMGYIKSKETRTTYVENLGKQIERIKQWAPNAQILFIGPSDMATSIDGTIQTYPHLPTVVDDIKAMVLSHGAAFWDLYSAMGGKNSMVQWAKSNPPLAGNDYVHFTTAGANKVSALLKQSILIYHSYYQRRNGINISPSVKNVPVQRAPNLLDSIKPFTLPMNK
ncbi:MAG: GDSL-type esterase/lipase family protein [Bacteroidales bacterium]|nr:GDSL-type esterase/lipase family protein [Bacteroidales bacterium]